MSGLGTAAGEEDAAIAVLQTGVDHNQESMTRLEREMADSSSRTEDLQGQMDALTPAHGGSTAGHRADRRAGGLDAAASP